MFSRSTRYYEAIYSFKNYDEEAKTLTEMIRKAVPEARLLLNIACGNGLHDQYLKKDFQLCGMDLLADFVDDAQRRNPECKYHQGDMRAFKLGQDFDVVCCLFSSIGYMQSEEELRQAIVCMAAHLKPGGLLLIEPWFTPEQWKPGAVFSLSAELEDGHICRMARSLTVDGKSVVEFEYLVVNSSGFERFSETHTLALFSQEQMRGSLECAGLNVEHDEEGLFGRGIWTGRKD